MKPLILGSLILLLPGALLLAQEPAPGSKYQRFQLITGTAMTQAGGQNPVILKIDTATGETWRYEALPNEPFKLNGLGVVEGWVPLNSNIGSAVEQFSKQLEDAVKKMQDAGKQKDAQKPQS